MPEALLPAIIQEPSGVHRASVIWLHGLGADGYDFEPIAGALDLPAALGVRFILPHAPRRAVTVNHGAVMRAWYDVLAADFTAAPDLAGIAASAAAVMALVEREIAAGIAPARIVLAGFSQGGVIALEAATHHQDRLAGAIGLSCYLPEVRTVPVAVRPFPIFLGHGLLDPVVPFDLGETAAETLEVRGYAVEWHRYSLPHAVSPAEIGDIRSWLLGLWAGA